VIKSYRPNVEMQKRRYSLRLSLFRRVDTDQRCQCSRGGYRGSPIRIAGAERPGFGQKALSRCCIAFGREKEVDRRTSECVAVRRLQRL